MCINLYLCVLVCASMMGNRKHTTSSNIKVTIEIPTMMLLKRFSERNTIVQL